jgi:uncharacterized protein YjeT (DUF2065 family)
MSMPPTISPELRKRAAAALKELQDRKLDEGGWTRVGASIEELRAASNEGQFEEALGGLTEALGGLRTRALDPSRASQPGYPRQWQRIPAHVNESVLELLRSLEKAPAKKRRLFTRRQ